MTQRKPVYLFLLVDAVAFRWYVAAVDREGETTPLLRSDEGDLDQYRDLEADAQVSFLRHRLAGVLQRGCERLYERDLKASEFVLILLQSFPFASQDVTERLAENLSQWMINPPVSFLMASPQVSLDPSTVNRGDSEAIVSAAFDVIAGDFSVDARKALDRALPAVLDCVAEPECWEVVSRTKNADSNRQ